MKLKLPDFEAILTSIREHPVVAAGIQWTKEKSLPGFFGVPIYDVVVFVVNEAQRDDLFTRANSIAFSFFLSLFPSILTIFTLVPFFLDALEIWVPEVSDFNITLYEEIQQIMPGQAGDYLFGFVTEITEKPQVGLLSFGFLLAIYFSSNGMLAMMQSFEKLYTQTFRRRSVFRKRIVAIMLTGVLGLLLVASAVFVILGDVLISSLTDFVNLSQFSAVLISATRWVIILALYYFTIGTLFRYGAATYRRFGYFSPGVTLAAVLSLISSIAFSFYIDGFNKYDTYNKFYGSIATIIIVMLWLQLNSLILLIGFELNASIAVNRDIKDSIDDEDEILDEAVASSEERRAAHDFTLADRVQGIVPLEEE